MGMVVVGKRSPARNARPTAGPISEVVAGILASPPAEVPLVSSVAAEEIAAALGEVEDPVSSDDLQLALYLCFQLHYRSFPGVDDAYEWNPTVLAARALRERAVPAAVRGAGRAGP